VSVVGNVVLLDIERIYEPGELEFVAPDQLDAHFDVPATRL
jgi:hypothetical protein